MLIITENQKARLREKIESEVIEAMDCAIDDLDVSDYIDSHYIEEKICEYLEDEIQNEVDSILDEVLDEFFS